MSNPDYIEALIDRFPSLSRKQQVIELKLLFEMGAQRIIQEYLRHEQEITLRQTIQGLNNSASQSKNT
jgi:hypothetical protein